MLYIIHYRDINRNKWCWYVEENKEDAERRLEEKANDPNYGIMAVYKGKKVNYSHTVKIEIDE